MEAQAFLDAFATVAEAPSGVDRLRDLVLDLAVRGRLVEQVAAEGHGRDVIEDGVRVIADAVDRGWTRQRNLPSPGTEELPYTIPTTWAWARLPQVSYGLGQVTPAAEFTYIDVSSVNGTDGSLGSVLAVVAPSNAPSRARKVVDQGAVLFSTIRPYLKNVVHIDRAFQPPAIASTAFAVLFPVPGLSPRFLKACLRSTYFSRFVESRQKGIAYPAINDGDLAFGLIPVPPPAEQDRIVAKVDELLVLCDEMEAQQRRRSRVSTRVRGSAFHALVTAETRDERRLSWERVSTNWMTLTEHSEGIPDLRQAVLQLAISGRLAAYTDGHLDVEGPDAPTHTQQTDSFALPHGWRWIEFRDLCDQITVGHVGPMAARYVSKGIPFLRSQNVGWFTYDPGDIKYIDADFHAELAKSALHGGEVLSVRSGNVGRTCVFPIDAGQANCADLVIMRVGRDLDPYYAAMVMNSPYGTAHVSSKKVGIAQAHFNVGAAKRMPTPLPPLAVQKELVRQVRTLLALADTLELSQSHQRLAAMRFAGEAARAAATAPA